MIKIGFMLILIGIIFLIMALAQWLQNRSYASCSEDTTASVVKKQRRYVKRGAVYELTVSYMVDGIQYQKVVSSLPTEYDSIEIGQQIDLKYKPQNPKRAVRPQQLNPKVPVFVFTIGTFCSVFGGLLIAFA